MNKWHNFTLVLISVLGLATVSPAIAEDNEMGVISVSGVGTVTAPPDMAMVNLTVLREAKTAREALKANNNAMNEIMNAMKAHQIEDKDLQTSNFYIQPKYVYPKQSNGRNGEPEIVAYQVSNSLSVRILDLEKVGEILDQSVMLGVNQGGNITFGNSDPEPLQMKARENAMKNAIEKAKVLTEAANVTLGKVKQITEGGSVSRPVPMVRAQMMAADAAMESAVPIASGENTYRITVDVTFELDQ